MLDPVSAIALATSAYRGIKKACEVGKEISSFTGAISQFAKAASDIDFLEQKAQKPCLLYTSPSPRDRQKSRMPSSA